MNDMKVFTLNYIQGEAIGILNQSIFSHIEKINAEDYRTLANTNSAKLNLPPANFFLYDGIIYPDTTVNGTPIRGVRVIAPPLHYSLIEQFDEIHARIRQAGHTELTNLFIHVLSISAHGIVLEDVLPTVLTTALKQKLGVPGYTLLNEGDPSIRLDRQTTEIALENLKAQYGATIENLRRTLMNQLLAVM